MQDIPLEDFDVEDVSGVENIVEDTTVIDSNEFEPIVIREDGIEISIEEIYTGFAGNNRLVYYKFHGKDLVEREQNALMWTAYIYLTKSVLVEMPICLSNQISEFEWVNTHCMGEDDFNSYSDDVKIVYTNRPIDDLNALSDVKIANLDDTLLFNYTSP